MHHSTRPLTPYPQETATKNARRKPNMSTNATQRTKKFHQISHAIAVRYSHVWLILAFTKQSTISTTWVGHSLIATHYREVSIERGFSVGRFGICNFGDFLEHEFCINVDQDQYVYTCKRMRDSTYFCRTHWSNLASLANKKKIGGI